MVYNFGNDQMMGGIETITLSLRLGLVGGTENLNMGTKRGFTFGVRNKFGQNES